MDSPRPAPSRSRGDGRPAAARARVVTDVAEICALRAVWERCLRHLPQAEMQLDPDWLLIQYPRTDASQFPAAAVAEDGEDVVGILPCRVLPFEWPCRLGYRTVANLRMTMADVCGEFVAAAPRAEVHEALLCAFAGSRPGVDLLFFECLRTDSLLWKVIGSSPRVRRCFRVYTPQPPSAHSITRLPETFDEYLAGFGRRSRQRMRKWREELNAACGGKLEIRRITERDQVRDFLRCVERVSALGWKGKRLGKIFRASEQSLEEFGAYADRGWLRSYLVLNGERPICFIIGYQYGDVLILDETGYDPVWEEHQPGKTLILEILRDAFAFRRPAVVDYGYGESSLKRYFGNESFTDVNVYLVRRTPRATAAWAAHAACGGLSRLIRRLLDLAGLRGRFRRRLRGAPDQSAP